MRVRDFILLGLLFLWLFLAVRSFLGKKKSGCGGCSGSQCNTCSMQKCAGQKKS